MNLPEKTITQLILFGLATFFIGYLVLSLFFMVQIFSDLRIPGKAILALVCCLYIPGILSSIPIMLISKRYPRFAWLWIILFEIGTLLAFVFYHEEIGIGENLFKRILLVTVEYPFLWFAIIGAFIGYRFRNLESKGIISSTQVRTPKLAKIFLITIQFILIIPIIALTILVIQTKLFGYNSYFFLRFVFLYIGLIFVEFVLLLVRKNHIRA